jgi:hypothetical protein
MRDIPQSAVRHAMARGLHLVSEALGNVKQPDGTYRLEQARLATIVKTAPDNRTVVGEQAVPADIDADGLMAALSAL